MRTEGEGDSLIPVTLKKNFAINQSVTLKLQNLLALELASGGGRGEQGGEGEGGEAAWLYGMK